jgi:hypothetical protein
LEKSVRNFSWRSIGTLLALALIVVGYFGPWVAHKDAGLILSADDLAEFIKFMPIVRSGQAGVMRELFFVPIWLAAMGLSLFGGRSRAVEGRIGLLLLSVILVLTPLPPFTFLVEAYRSPEFGLTFWTTVTAALISVALAILGRRLPDRVEASLWILLGLAVASIAPLHFIKIQPEIVKLYAFTIGWGFWAVIMGGVALSAIGVMQLIGRKKNLAKGSRSIG